MLSELITLLPFIAFLFFTIGFLLKSYFLFSNLLWQKTD